MNSVRCLPVGRARGWTKVGSCKGSREVSRVVWPTKPKNAVGVCFFSYLKKEDVFHRLKKDDRGGLCSILVQTQRCLFFFVIECAHGEPKTALRQSSERKRPPINVAKRSEDVLAAVCLTWGIYTHVNSYRSKRRFSRLCSLRPSVLGQQYDSDSGVAPSPLRARHVQVSPRGQWCGVVDRSVVVYREFAALNKMFATVMSLLP